MSPGVIKRRLRWLTVSAVLLVAVAVTGCSSEAEPDIDFSAFGATSTPTTAARDGTLQRGKAVPGDPTARPRSTQAGTGDPILLDLAARVSFATKQAQQGFIYPEDEVTFGLLLLQMNTGKPPTIEVVDETLSRALSGQQIPGFRLRGFRGYWANHAGVDWARFPLNAFNFMFSYGGYLETKQAARVNALNQVTGAMVGSETAWRSTMNDINRRQQAQQARDAFSRSENDAWRAILDAEAAMAAAEEAIQGR